MSAGDQRYMFYSLKEHMELLEGKELIDEEEPVYKPDHFF